MFNITSFLRKSVFVWYWYQGVTKLVVISFRLYNNIPRDFCRKSPKSFLTYKKAKMQSSPIQQCTICPQYLRLLPALFFSRPYNLVLPLPTILDNFCTSVWQTTDGRFYFMIAENKSIKSRKRIITAKKYRPSGSR